MLAISITAIVFSVYLIYPGYKLHLKVLNYSSIKVNIICYLLIFTSVLINALALYLLIIIF